jgi:3-deoxy-manno-octulosonate cytidylyltransferase (CMP-KDO synthetase)
MAKALILIPARYQSSRFPGKPLAPIKNKSMIQRVYENCFETGYKTVIVTDDDRIESHCQIHNLEYVRVDDDVSSGTERNALAYERHFAKENYDLVVNVQGDEPLLPSSDIKELVEFHEKSTYDMTTLIRERSSNEREELKNPNNVKALYIEKRKQCLYFSRAPIPFDRDGDGEFSWYHHIGVYCYRPHALVAYLVDPPTEIEMTEKLEQLRAFDMGFTLGAHVTDYVSIGVDTPEDIKKVEEVI